jgi:hypothetical protein
VIEGLLLAVFVAVIVLLMRSISRPLPKGRKRTLGLFSYSDDAHGATPGSVKKG